jgi:hypothetical protein
VIGQANDSTFADAFAGARWLGRRMLPCRHAGAYPDLQASLTGDWLVLVCAAPEETTRDVELQVYRVRDVDP